MSNKGEDTRHSEYHQGFNDGYKKGYDRGFEEGLEKGKRTASGPEAVHFLKIQCECGALNFHPVFNNRLVINADEERRCCSCEKTVSRDVILAYYSRLQSKSRS